MSGSIIPVRDRKVSYLGQVATRSFVPDGKDLTKNQCCSRTLHIARDDIRSLKIAIPNFFVDTGASGVETDLAEPMLCTASIEYPAGTFKQVLFSGAAQGSVPAGEFLVSDAVSVSIAFGERFFIRIWYSNAGGVIMNDGWMPKADDLAAFDVTVPDYTMGGTITPTTSVSHFTACAILGMTKRQSVILFGDSIMHGVASVATESSGDQGIAATSIGRVAGYINAAAGGDKAQWFVANNAKRIQLVQYCSDVIVQYGTNDLSGGRTKLQIQGDLNTITDLMVGKKVYVNTIPPRTTSTDTWDTVANQTVVGTESIRILLNTALRYGGTPSGITNAAGVFDVCRALESGFDSGAWNASPTYLPTTGDGIHPGAHALTLLKWMGIIDPALFCMRG